jgi:hypothetical protein
VVVVDGVGDGVEQVGLAQPGFSVDEQGVVVLGGVVGHGPGGGVGKLVGRAHHKALEGIFLGAGQEIVVFFLTGPALLHFAGAQHQYVEFGGEQLVQGLFHRAQIAGGDDVLFEVGGGIEHKAVLLQSDRFGVVKPGVDGGGGHIRLHQGEHTCPDVCGGIHRRTSHSSVFRINLVYQKKDGTQ